MTHDQYKDEPADLVDWVIRMDDIEKVIQDARMQKMMGG